MTGFPRWIGALALVAALGACGSDKAGSGTYRAVKGLLAASVGLGKAGGAPAPALSRADLQKVGAAVTVVELQGLTMYMVPAGTNRDVTTWTSAEDRTVALRDGLMIATRGFGPDIMQAAAPSVGQLAAGHGTVQRSYFYLDGADQTRRFDYTCTLAAAGSETITVFGRQHNTRHVTETCRSAAVEFTNHYWFEGGNFIRKSKQLLVPEWGYATISRVIDNP